MSVEVPLEIAQQTQITWTMTPHATPSRAKAITNNTPNASTHSVQFGVAPLSPQSNPDAASDDIFGDLVTRVETVKPEPSSVQLTVPDVQPVTPSPSPSQRHAATPTAQSASRSRPEHATHRSTNTFGQDFPVPTYDNEIKELDPSWAKPIYPRKRGDAHPDDPLPNFPIAPRNYYTITKGLHLGVFYAKW
jgi:hypothetical protein